MPWTEKQNKLFRAAAHDPAIAKKHDIPQSTAQRLASEGVKKDSSKDVARHVISHIMMYK